MPRCYEGSPASVLPWSACSASAPLRAGPKLGTGAGDNQIDGLAVAFAIDQPLARLGSGIFSPYAVPIRQGPGWRGGRVWLGFQP